MAGARGNSQHHSLLDVRDSMIQGLTQLNWVNSATKRPEKTSAGRRQLVAGVSSGSHDNCVFDNDLVKSLDISVMIDDYNHYMNRVNLANQYRAAYASNG
ncbi:uncharacterized protein PADG_11212 [Paracoccidioides brasiliensis Pb18]|uniref:Uncharacterized protein n=2 Tax=Paracoccidioides brasiliensis TaxID=121759 RepID=A0A0A0HUC6_PARBD|nr:uncharacterized protein PADG_11212 [Paracoccidioides brasiliensis Pb18]KGM92754.1 hypothetical protein PADG_11212 [Paracoccidioides brasiliensis Pb18]